MKFQAIVTPDGITTSITGPFVGCSHEQKVLEFRGITPDLLAQLDHRRTKNISYRIYGDPACKETELIRRPFLNSNIILYPSIQTSPEGLVIQLWSSVCSCYLDEKYSRLHQRR